MIAWPLLVSTGAFGLCLGSFVTTAALRIARDEAFLAGRSHCDTCGMSLGFTATVPVVGYALRRGACSHCGGAIDPAHLAGEIVGALLATLPLAIAGPARGSLIAALGLILLGAAVVDLKTQRLPNALTFSAAALSAALAWTLSPSALMEGVAASLVTALVLLTVRIAYRRRRAVDGLGLGDIKLLAALALWLGAATPWAVCVGAAAGLVTVRWRRPLGQRVPFGPFIAAGALLVGLIQEAAGWPLRL